MKQWFSKLFKKAPPSPRKDYKVFYSGGGWGCNITTTVKNAENNLLSHTGHWTPKPVVGDVMYVRMKNGSTGIAVFTKVENVESVYDMFFAESYFLGTYVDITKNKS